jgi:beta-N-acetylhexosaminidase
VLEKLVGQLVVPYVNGAGADEPHEANRARFGVTTAAEAVRDLHFGGVIYFDGSGNTQSPQQIAKLSADLQQVAGGSLMISIDHEVGGVVDRVGSAMTQFPTQWVLGRSADVTGTVESYTVSALELRAMGVTCDFAPVADVNVNPDNPIIGTRSFGADPELVSLHTAAAVRALQDGGLSAVAKHFPGHGDTAVDSHLALPVITHTREEWSRLDAPPFRAAVNAGVDSIMLGHLAFPDLDPSGLPATLSRPMIQLLREELAFDGVIMSDSLRMEGVRIVDDSEVAIRTLEAGADLLLDPPWPAQAIAAVVAAVRSGRLSRDQIEASAQRVQAMNARANAQAIPPLEVVGASEHRERARRIADQFQ